MLPHFSESVSSEINQLWRSFFFFWKFWKFNLAFKNFKKVFLFKDNSIWIGCFKLSLLRREYLREIFFNWITFTLINKYAKGSVVQIWTVFGPVWHVVCRRFFSNVTLYIFVEPHFSESVISEIHPLWGHLFMENVQNLV